MRNVSSLGSGVDVISSCWCCLKVEDTCDVLLESPGLGPLRIYQALSLSLRSPPSLSGTEVLPASPSPSDLLFCLNTCVQVANY